MNHDILIWMIIIGITGTLGAGKGTVVAYLEKKWNFQHFSVRGFLLNEIRKRNLPENRDSMVLLANDLRAKNSPSYIVDQLYEQAKDSGINTVIESIRTLGEVKSLKSKGNFYLFAVNADPETRYSRIQKRASETDHINFETFLENEKREMNSNDPNKQNLSACIKASDFVFNNNGSTEELYEQVSLVLNEIMK